MIDTLLQLYMFVILARVLMSWVPGLSQNPIGEVIHQITEPVLAPIRGVLQQLLPPSMGMIDLSPIVVFFLIQMLMGIV